MSELKNFIEIEVEQVNQIQEDSPMFLGKIKFKDLLTIHQYTWRKESEHDPFGKSKIKLPNADEEEFQRQLSQEKLNKIEKYFKEKFEKIDNKEKSSGFFHTAMVLALKHEYDYDSEKITEKNYDKILDDTYNKEVAKLKKGGYDREELAGLISCFLNDKKNKLFIPKTQKIALIVDGQHRFYGLNQFYDKLKDGPKKDKVKEFEFITTFLVGLDPYEVGQVFATINFTQKPVNRSLYYDIFGSIPDARNEIKLAHDLALHLNNNSDSPLKDMIKMLGKGYGLISQAFFVREMEKLFKGVWNDLFTDYQEGGSEYKKIPQFMRIYLECIEETYSYAWPNFIRQENEKYIYSSFSYDYILCKTTGLGAFFRLINEIYPIVKGLSQKEMREKIIKMLKRIRESEAQELFSKDNETFGKVSGEGVVNKFYRHIRLKLKLNEE